MLLGAAAFTLLISNSFWDEAKVLMEPVTVFHREEDQAKFRTPFPMSPNFEVHLSPTILRGANFLFRRADLLDVTIVDLPHRLDYGASMFAERYLGAYGLFLFEAEDERRVFFEEHLLAYETLKDATFTAGDGKVFFAYFVRRAQVLEWLQSKGLKKDFKVMEVGEIDYDSSQAWNDCTLYFRGSEYVGYSIRGRFYRLLDDPAACRRKLAYASHAAIYQRNRGMIR